MRVGSGKRAGATLVCWKHADSYLVTVKSARAGAEVSINIKYGDTEVHVVLLCLSLV